MITKLTRCVRCDRRGGVTVVSEFGKEKLAGTFCKKCSFFIPDPLTVKDNVACDCGKQMGTVSRDAQVKVEGVLFYPGKAKRQYRCAECSQKRVKAGDDDPEIHTRHAVMCSGGCGKQQGWLDLPEGVVPQNIEKAGSCQECDLRLSQIVINNRIIDGEIEKL